jgi:3-isopropylmalate/(R)-2-methylmalate dehydratase small subunit
MDRANVDTDLIIPKQFLKSIKRSGFGPNLFDELRYLDEGQPGQDCSGRPLNPDFPLNQPRYAGCVDSAGAGELRLRIEPRARPLGAGGLRLSLHHRAELRGHLLQQLLQEWRAAGGAAAEQVEELFGAALRQEGFPDRGPREQRGAPARRPRVAFTVEDYRRQCLLEGLDDIGVTLKSADAIRAYEARSAERFPWLLPRPGGRVMPPRTAPARRLHRQEIVPEGQRVLEAVAAQHGLELSIERR